MVESKKLKIGVEIAFFLIYIHVVRTLQVAFLIRGEWLSDIDNNALLLCFKTNCVFSRDQRYMHIFLIVQPVHFPPPLSEVFILCEVFRITCKI